MAKSKHRPFDLTATIGIVGGFQMVLPDDLKKVVSAAFEEAQKIDLRQAKIEVMKEPNDKAGKVEVWDGS